MNLGDDFSLSRDAKLIGLAFLESEMHRHIKDIEDIENLMDEMKAELKVTKEEDNAIMEMARRYVDF